MRIHKVLVVSLAAVGLIVALLAPASATTPPVTTGPAINNANLMNGGRPCSTSTPPVLGYLANQLEVVGTDPNPTFDSRYVFSFQLWPVSDPTAVTAFSTTNYAITDLARGLVPAGTLVSGNSYSWHVQLSDSNGTSPWSQTCVFSYDYVLPQTPTISSSNFPADGTRGPIGQLAQFTFAGNGDPDTVGFDWTWGDDLGVRVCSASGPQGQLVCPDPLTVPGVILADAPGGTASLAVPPPGGLVADLTVAAVDRAGNESRPVSYRINVPYSAPTATVTSGYPSCNKATVAFAPHAGVTDVVSYTYTTQSINGDAPVTVRADKTGQAIATVDVSTQPFGLTVTSLSANGFRSSLGATSLQALNPQPWINSTVYNNYGQPAGGVGVTGTFTFHPPFDDHPVSSYQYRFHNGPARTVAADPNDQSATVQYTPTRAGTDTLTVSTINGDSSGGSCEASYTFIVADPAH